jgi:F-type H+-transporting ATPase subunit delta
MARVASAKRYAQAVFELALERDELDKWQSDLGTITEALREPELITLLENPKLHFDEKTELLGEMLMGVSPLAMNLVYLLISRSQLRVIGDIAAEYELLADAHRGVEHAEVTTAISLDDESERKLKQRLAAITGREVMIHNQVEPAIMGGVVAKVGDKLLDGSTRSKLEALRKELIETAR